MEKLAWILALVVLVAGCTSVPYADARYGNTTPLECDPVPAENRTIMAYAGPPMIVDRVIVGYESYSDEIPGSIITTIQQNGGIVRPPLNTSWKSLDFTSNKSIEIFNLLKSNSCVSYMHFDASGSLA